jgi:hypothetical protein
VQMRVRKSFQEGDTAKPAAMASEGTVQWPALGAVVGPFVFTLCWFVLGFLSPGYTLWGTRIAPLHAHKPAPSVGLVSAQPAHS